MKKAKYVGCEFVLEADENNLTITTNGHIMPTAGPEDFSKNEIAEILEVFREEPISGKCGGCVFTGEQCYQCIRNTSFQDMYRVEE